MASRMASDTMIHPTAIVDPQAEIGEGCQIGPHSVIGPNVRLGAKTVVGAHCVFEGYTTIGSECQFFTGAVIGSPPQDLKFEGEKTELIIGDRNRIREYVTINPGTKGGISKTVLGSDCLLMAYSHVAHDCVVGNHVIIANSAALAGHITIEDHVVIGGLVGIHQFARVGTVAIIGGCSRVMQDVPPYSTCVGYPAKVFGLNNEGLRRADVAVDVKDKLHKAFRILFNSGLSMSHALEQVEQHVEPCDEVRHLLEFIRQSKRGVCRA